MTKIMKFLLLALSFTVLLTSISLSEGIDPIVDNISKAKDALTDIQKKLDRNAKTKILLDGDVKALNGKIAEHKAKHCQEVQSGDCDWLKTEGDKLRNDATNLQDAINLSKAEKDGLEQQQHYQENRIHVQFGLLRIQPYFGCLEPFRNAVLACSDLNPIPAAGCLAELWVNHC